jgi:hypothetical protein
MTIRRSSSRWSDEQSHEDRTDDSDRNMSVSQDYTAYPLSLSAESAASRLQTGKGMAIRTYGFGTMDPRPDEDRREFLNRGRRNVCR